VLFDVVGKNVVNFNMAGNGLFLAGLGVDVDIMPGTVPKKGATRF